MLLQQGKKSQERIQKLNGIGFVWGVGVGPDRHVANGDTI
jgi:hypothetical protein